MLGKSPLGSVIKHYFISAYYGIIGADELAQGAPAAILGINDGYFIVGHHNSPAFAHAYAETATITLFLVKFGHF
jgi:hypothetical protein